MTADEQGLAWSWNIDLAELLEALSDAEPGDQGSPGGILTEPADDTAPTSAAETTPTSAAETAHGAEADLPPMGTGRVLGAGEVASRVAERLIPGPGLAAMLGAVPAPALADHDLPAVAAGFRRIASWATAAELSAVAQIACRSAARDSKIGVLDDGRPARVSQEAASEVALAETMSQFGASWWTDLAVVLTWRLRSTGAALSGGLIDLSRARLIAEATGVLTDDAARAVEQKVLPTAGRQTIGQLRAALRRAVISADPNGADQRRKEAERRARVMLYPDEEGTAGLAGQRLSAVHAAAAMARIQAIARAWKASGAGGGNDLLQAQVFIGLLCGTLPYIPPAEGAPPDELPDEPPDEPRPDLRPAGNSDDGRPAASGPRNGGPVGGGPVSGGPADGGPADGGPGNTGAERGEDIPPLRDEDAPSDDGCPDDDRCQDADAGWPSQNWDHDDDDEWLVGAGPVPAWPELPDILPPGLGALPASRPADGRPTGGLLDLTMPWTVMARVSDEPGMLGRIGPITCQQARQLADHAARDPAAVWRVIVTNSAGQALAVARVPHLVGSRRGRDRPGPGPDSRDGPRPNHRDGPWPDSRDRPAVGVGLVGRVTLTISRDALQPDPDRPPDHEPLDHVPPDHGSPGRNPAGAIAIAAFRTAIAAVARAAELAEADTVAGGCAHRTESPTYRPRRGLLEQVVARDVTCRFPTCRQPAWRGDLDHTIPHHRGGRTCRCNLGALCRTHHQIKQLAGWRLNQPRSGIFQWTTPAGRTYISEPDAHPV